MRWIGIGVVGIKGIDCVCSSRHVDDVAEPFTWDWLTADIKRLGNDLPIDMALVKPTEGAWPNIPRLKQCLVQLGSCASRVVMLGQHVGVQGKRRLRGHEP